MLVMIDMGVGNLDSARRAFARVGAEVQLTSQAETAARADVLILPGVGAFGDGMAALRQAGLLEPIRQHAQNGKPLLGICLGMQLLADASEEHGRHEGLGLLPGSVRRLQPASAACRVPNMGWCDVAFHHRQPPFDRCGAMDTFYFAHSYYFQCAKPSDIAATIDYDGCSIPVAVRRGNLCGVQFHPEKSQDAGLLILESFVEQVLKNTSIIA